MAIDSLFGGCYAGRRVLVTGHTGFKGSWLVCWLHAMGADVGGLALDPLSPSHWTALGLPLEVDARVDLRNAREVRRVVEDFSPEVIFHLAAQSLVRRGYRDPAMTFEVNVQGLVNVFEAVRACGSVRVVINATTDKVYEPIEPARPFHEADSLGGHDPYSASKACAEIVSASYRRSFFSGVERESPVRLATARAGNVIGGGDWAEDRLIPDLVRAAASGSPLRLRNPAATRPWQHVLDPLAGYLRLGQVLLSGASADGAWNFGPDPTSPLSVRDVVRELQHVWPSLAVTTDTGSHPHEAEQLSLDCNKAANALGWQPVWGSATALQRTAAWYDAYQRDGSLQTMSDLQAYATDARASLQAWAT